MTGPLHSMPLPGALTEPLNVHPPLGLPEGAGDGPNAATVIGLDCVSNAVADVDIGMSFTPKRPEKNTACGAVI